MQRNRTLNYPGNLRFLEVSATEPMLDSTDQGTKLRGREGPAWESTLSKQPAEGLVLFLNDILLLQHGDG